MTDGVHHHSDRDLVRDLVIWMEGRRALWKGWEDEGEWYVNHGVLNIRSRLDESLERLDHTGTAFAVVRSLRERCNDYLTAVTDPAEPYAALRPSVAKALKRLREAFREELHTLADCYDVPEASDLANRITRGTNW